MEAQKSWHWANYALCMKFKNRQIPFITTELRKRLYLGQGEGTDPKGAWELCRMITTSCTSMGILVIWVHTVVTTYKITYLFMHFMVSNYIPQLRRSIWVFWRQQYYVEHSTHWMLVSSWNSNVDTLPTLSDGIGRAGPLGDDYLG